jgi:hypothetical protein
MQRHRTSVREPRDAFDYEVDDECVISRLVDRRDGNLDPDASLGSNVAGKRRSDPVVVDERPLAIAAMQVNAHPRPSW